MKYTFIDKKIGEKILKKMFEKMMSFEEKMFEDLNRFYDVRFLVRECEV